MAGRRSSHQPHATLSDRSSFQPDQATLGRVIAVICGFGVPHMSLSNLPFNIPSSQEKVAAVEHPCVAARGEVSFHWRSPVRLARTQLARNFIFIFLIFIPSIISIQLSFTLFSSVTICRSKRKMLCAEHLFNSAMKACLCSLLLRLGGMRGALEHVKVHLGVGLRQGFWLGRSQPALGRSHTHVCIGVRKFHRCDGWLAS